MRRVRSNSHSGTNGEARKADLALVASDAAAERVARAREEVIRAVPEIIHAFLEQARQASVTHARFVFDFAGIAGLKGAEAQKSEGPSFAEILTKGLGLREPEER
ncbi:MAG: hypothetical protein L0099_10250 [Acidobacteria bacterium]|nr:hypothetical protein [Acidobacteriota bacterium]